jgi:hypothetical protein
MVAPTFFSGRRSFVWPKIGKIRGYFGASADVAVVRYNTPQQLIQQPRKKVLPRQYKAVAPKLIATVTMKARITFT